MTAKPTAIPEEHDDCDGDLGCVLCQAEHRLTPDDWEIVRFYRVVADQVENLAPFGTEDKKTWLTPRLGDWMAAADLLELPRGSARRLLIEQTRFLNAAIQGRVSVGGVFTSDPEELMPAVEWSEDSDG